MSASEGEPSQPNQATDAASHLPLGFPTARRDSSGPGARTRSHARPHCRSQHGADQHPSIVWARCVPDLSNFFGLGAAQCRLHDSTWSIDVPSCRVQGDSPTFGSIILFFFQKSTTRSYYLMNFSTVAMRGAEIWHIWKQHHLIECFWKILKSIFHIRAM